MAENRGNPSGSKSNLPNPNGVTRPNNNFKNIDTHTLKEMRTVYSGLTKFAVELGGDLKDFNEVIEKSANTLVNTRQKLDKTAEEYDIQVAEMRKHYFSANKKIADDYEKFVEEKKQLMEKEFEEIKKEERKNIIKQSFKNESKQNEIKFMNNKFSKGNNLASTSNEYYNQLEKLKSDALDVYGEGFENNKEYKKALLNLNDEYAKNMKDAWKEDFKENHKVLGGIASGIKDTFERNKETLQGLLGPLNLFIAPLKDFFGGFGAVFKFIGGGVKKLFGKFTKKNPTASDVLKSGAFGVGALYIGSKLEQMFGETKDKKEIKKGFLDKLMSLKESGGIIGLLKGLPSLLKTIPILGTALRGAGLLRKSAMKNLFVKGGGLGKFFKSGATKTAFKAMGPMMIVTSIIEMAIDAIKGIFKSKEWGVSKVSGGIGSFLGGASEGGLKNAFASMGKWALLGAGIGSVVPVIGTIAGGLVGGAIGGILGWIGGEKISKALESVGTFFKGVFTKTMEGLKKAWGKTKEFAKLAKDKTIIKSKQVKEAIGTFISSSTKAIGEKVGKMKDFASNVWGGLKNLGSEAWSSFKDGTLFTNFIPDLLNKIKDKLFEGWNMLKESPLGQFVQKLFENIQNGMEKFFNENPIGKWLDSHIIAPIKNAFGQMGAWFSYIGDAFSKDGITGALSAMTVGMIKKDKSTGLTDFEAYKQNLLNPTNVDDAIIRTDGSIIKTNPKDTLVALKDVPLSMEQVRNDTTKNLNSSLNGLGSDKTLEKKLTTIIDVLSKILAKDVQVNLPPQTRGDLDMIMSGGMI